MYTYTHTMGKYGSTKRKYFPRGFKKKSYNSRGTNTYAKLADKKINTLWEQRAVEIAQQQDDTSPWLLSRVDHFVDGITGKYGGSHKSPVLNQMIKLSNNTIWYQDISQLSNDPADPGDGMDPGLYQIKTIQSRLRFYVTGIFPVHCRVVILKIKNSGNYGIPSANPLIPLNADINPTWNMVGDTSLRYSGIHKQELASTAPGQKNHTIIAQEKFTIIPNDLSIITSVTPDADGNSKNFQVVKERQVILTKTYKNYLKIIQTLQTTTADNKLTVAQNRCKSVGDRIFLVIYADHQQNWTDNAGTPAPGDQMSKSSNLYFYGTSGTIYNYDKKFTQVSEPMPDESEITQASYVS